MAEFLWQIQDDWPSLFRWDTNRLVRSLAAARRAQGELAGRAVGVGFEADQRMLEAMVDEAITTSAIEGETLNRESVRSSVARRLGLEVGRVASPRPVDGLVEMLLDATRRWDAPLTDERLKSWHAALFPTGYSGLKRITVGDWRTDPEPMRVVSGVPGRETVHFEAVPSDAVAGEMSRYLRWFQAGPGEVDGMIFAGVAHLYLVTIHPFEDGNGRIGRAVTDLALARDEQSPTRLWSLSKQVGKERGAYYDTLERAQRGTGDLTDWLIWFLGCAGRALDEASGQVDLVVQVTRFWDTHRARALNERQRKAVNRMLDAGPGGFEGGMNNRKYVALTRTSKATAARDLAELRDWGLVRLREGAGGRSTSYVLVWP